MSNATPLPTLQIYRAAEGFLRFKLPAKGARWQGRFRTLEELVAVARRQGLPEPCELDFLTEAEARA